MRYPSCFIALGLVLGVAPCAFATNSNVSGPSVGAGVADIEFRGGIEFDENNADHYRQRLHLDYGLNDTLALRIITRQEQREGGHLEYRATDVEARMQLFEDEAWGFDGGFKVAYSKADGDDGPDELTLYWLYEIKRYGFSFRQNALVGTQFGEEADQTPTAELRWQALANIWENHSLGLEMFNDFGPVNEWTGYNEQGHRIGPVLKGKLAQGVNYQTGMLFGISDDAPDIGIKFFIGTSF